MPFAMELRHLRYFVAVAEAESITRAAERLNLSQPPLSRQIRDLEEELGAPLFVRTTHQVRLTHAGKAFLIEARAVLQHVHDAVGRFRAVANRASGDVTVGYSPLPMVEVVPRALRLLRKAAPQVRVSLLDLSADECVTQLGQRSLDLALVVRPPRLGGLEFECLGELRVGVIVAPDHPLARRRSISLERALAEPLVTYIKRGYSDYHDWMRRVVRRHSVRPRIAAEVDGAPSLVAAVEANQGIGFTPPTIAATAGRRVRFLTLDPPVEPIEIGIVGRRGPLPAAAQAFVDALRMAAKK
jgi:DNA-binding transcriptional LysR family regulator